jgi:hypothetical protein
MLKDMIKNEQDFKMIQNYRTLKDINLFEVPNFSMETQINDFEKDKWFQKIYSNGMNLSNTYGPES